MMTNIDVDSDIVTITKTRFDAISRKLQWLRYLEAAGVDNWQGIEFAQDMAREDGFFGDGDD